ncbi:hypothetical protein CDV31_007553 [Fusarium ambrosium]|uniref:Heterokaryon incompatibility domain-containing protein n=1 Tax=Fusarium ambrosium TaxID=131363 RepID=A0A428U5U3_9HYPO|nr:hypothetical protein CDV31_007553 [Fusarium ambrosium]
MRLLNTTSLKLEYFVGYKIPKYAILSHRWETEEILFEDVQTDKWPQKKGIDKVKRACLRASEDGFKYIWIDTCCIDKSSSAELSEAINSMFDWYHRSQVCYAYLCDVPTGDMKAFTKSEWFTRGWTLQELIAPEQVQFLDNQWRLIGDRLSLLEPIVEITAIDRRVLGRGEHEQDCPSQAQNLTRDWLCRCGGRDASRTFRPLISSFSVGTRMSWASKRVTTRVEDGAYALLGLFNVNMPLLYGEGAKAFRRLQDNIIRDSNDQSILACQHRNWVGMVDQRDHLFPPDARAFRLAANLERSSTSSEYLSMKLTNRSLNIDLQICPCWKSDKNGSKVERKWLGILDCVYSDDYLSRPAIILDRLSSAENDQPVFVRTLGTGSLLFRVSPGPLPDNCIAEGDYDEGIATVQLNPSRIKMMNVDLLIHRNWTQGVLTPAVRVNPTIGGHSSMAYQIRISFPELQGTPNGRHVRDRRTFMVRKPQEFEDAEPGILALDDGSDHGFFIAYGFLVTYAEEHDNTAAPPKFHPWCRLFSWHQIVPDQEFTPKYDELANVIQRMALFPFSYDKLPRSISEARPRDSMDWPGLRAKGEMTPNTFLGKTVYDLEISVGGIEEQKLMSRLRRTRIYR